jgi:hypothetical protein
MLKLLYKPTGNIFTLPDKEAIEIKNADRGNDYVILEAGLQEEVIAQITQEEVKEIEEVKEQEAEALEAQDKEEAKETEGKKESDYFKKFDASDLKKLTKEELEVMASKLGIPSSHNQKKAELIAKIEELTGIKA